MSATMAPEVPAQTAGDPKKGGRRGPARVKIELAGEPTVQLLPSSIRDRATTRSRMRTGVLFIVLGLLIAAGLVVLGTVRATQAQQALDAANARSVSLIAEQAKYADAVAMDRLITQAHQLQASATETEIDWGPLIRSLISQLPAGGELTTVSGVSLAPWEAIPAAEGVDVEALRQSGFIATIELDLTTTTIQDATMYSRSLANMPGFLGATISTVAVGVDGRVTSNLTLLLGMEAASGRFADDGDAASSDGGDATTEAGTDPDAADTRDDSTESEG